MKTVSLGELYKMNFFAEPADAMEQCWWKDGDVFRYVNRPRHSHALLYLSGCSMEYYEDEKSVLHAEKGSVVYIPQGLRYTCKFLGAKKGQESTILIEFYLKDEKHTPIKLSEDIRCIKTGNTGYLHQLFLELAEIYNTTLQSPAIKKACLYRLLAELSNMQRCHDIYTKKYRNIAKGILYLEQDAEQKLSIEQVAEMCNVSSNCFRRLFKEYSGQSPSDFRLHVKINRAKNLLSNNMISVTEVAYMAGFDDPAYFSKVFKQKVGLSPKDYAVQFGR